MPNDQGPDDNNPQKTRYESDGKGPADIYASAIWKEGDIIAGLYEVKGVIGEGRFGTVYKVYHRSWKIDLAVKSLKEDVLEDKVAARRFLKEAETWVEMGMHPNIVTCFYVRVLDKIPRIFLEYAEGGTLRDKLNNSVSLEEALDFGIQICRGMDYAHKHKLVHRDLKPENCVMDKYGNLKVTDFGLVKLEEAGGISEQKGMGKTGKAGTPEYMAPEQWMNAAEATTKADIWALGIILYEMCAGRKPFNVGEDEPEYAYYTRLISSRWACPELPQNLPKELITLIKECLNEKPGSRPGSCNNLEQRLSEIYGVIAGQPYPREKVKEIPLLADGLNNRAVSLIDLGRDDAALEIFKKALSIEPSHLLSTFNRGLLLWREARITDQQLVTRLNDIDKVTIRSNLAKYLLGLVHLERGDWQAAITALEAVLRHSQIGKDNVAVNEAKEALDKAREGLKKHGRSNTRLSGHDEWVTAVPFTPYGGAKLSGNHDRTLSLWDIKGRRLRTYEGHTGIVTNVCVSIGGNIGLSGSHDKTVRLWDIATGRCLRTFEGCGDSVNSIRISLDGRLGVSENTDKTLRAFDLTTGPAASFAIALPQDHAELSRLDIQANSYLTQADSAVNSGSLRKAASYLNLARGLQGYSQSRSILDSYNNIGFRGVRRDLVSAWHLLTLGGHSDSVNSVCISPDGKFGLSGSRDKTLRLWNLATGQSLRVFKGHSNYLHTVCAFSDGKFGLSGSWDNTLRLWELATGRCLRIFQGSLGRVASVCTSPDGRFALSGREVCNTLLLWNLDTKKCFRPFEGHTNGVRSVSMSPDGRFALSGSRDKTLRLWDLARGRCLHTLEGHNDSVSSVCISPDGKYGLSGSWDKTLRLWDLATGQCLRTLEGHTGRVYSVCVSPDGRFALSGSEDKTLQLWDLATGKSLRIFEGHAASVSSVCISPDGRFGLSGGEDKTLRLWEFVYDYDFPEETDWNEGAKPYLEIFLTLHTPYGIDGISRQGKSQWTEGDYKVLMRELGYRGYGWLREDGVRRKLSELALVREHV